MATDAEIVEQLETVWRSIGALGETLTEPEWKLPTDNPGWSVQDNLTHITGTEWMIQQRPAPDHVVPDGLSHVRNEIGLRNEVFVDSRRALSGTEALAEFREVTEARLAQLRTFTASDFDAASWTPIGPGTVRDLLPFRVFDSWVHEQDMRRAVGKPGHWTGPVPEAALGRIAGTMPYVVGKKVHPPDGTTVVFACRGPFARVVALEVQDGRARLLDAEPRAPTVTIGLDTEVFVRLACGRLDPAVARRAGLVALTGDEDLAARVLDEMNFLF